MTNYSQYYVPFLCSRSKTFTISMIHTSPLYKQRKVLFSKQSVFILMVLQYSSTIPSHYIGRICLDTSTRQWNYLVLLSVELFM